MSASGDDRASGQRRERLTISGVVLTIRDRLLLALSFLTILPTISRVSSSPDLVARSFAWFPLVGFLIGAVLAAEDLMLTPLFNPWIRALIVVMTLTIVSGGIHLDALGDCADGLGAGADRARALEIMRDSRVGSFGAAAIFFALALKIFAIGGAAGVVRLAALYCAPGIGRWAMFATATRMDYLRAQGAGTALLPRQDARSFLFASATVLVAAMPMLKLHALRGCVVAVLLTLTLRWLYRRWLGGVTGDLIGAAGEIVEIAVFIAMTS
jgi:adenosylcobinamide-GDP ribazoletransferase